MTLADQDRSTAKKKGWVAGATAIGTGAVLVLGHPVIAVAGVAATAYYTWDWFKFRAKRGMRF